MNQGVGRFDEWWKPHSWHIQGTVRSQEHISKQVPCPRRPAMADVTILSGFPAGFSFLRGASLARPVLGQVQARPCTQRDLAKALQVHRSTVGKTLGRLQRRGLVRVLEPNEHRIKHYVATLQGVEVWQYVRQEGDVSRPCPRCGAGGDSRDGSR